MKPELDSEDIKRIRFKFSLDQASFARIFGLSSARSVSNIETGFRKPGGTMVALLKLLDSLPLREAERLIGKLRRQQSPERTSK